MRRTVLCIESRPAALQVWRMSLQHAGYTVLATASGSEGLRLYKRVPEAVAAVLVDLKASGLSGMEVVYRIRAERSQVPIVLLCDSYWWPAEHVLRLADALVLKGEGAGAVVHAVQELVAARSRAAHAGVA